MNRVLKVGGLLIALYLVVNYATGFGTAVTNASTGTSNVVKAFQGR